MTRDVQTEIGLRRMAHQLIGQLPPEPEDALRVLALARDHILEMTNIPHSAVMFSMVPNEPKVKK